MSLRPPDYTTALAGTNDVACRLLSWTGTGDAMHDAFSRIPVTVLLSTDDTRTLCSASDATIFMMEKEKWPEEHGSS